MAIRRINHYLVFGLAVILFNVGVYFLAMNIDKLPIKTSNYFSETDKIKSGLNFLIKYKCDKEGGDIKEKWICENKEYKIEAIEADRDRSYATGTGKTENGIDFFWVAVKNESWWNVMGFGKNGEEILCEYIPEEVGAKRFKGKYRYCEDKNKMTVDRLVIEK